MDQTIVDLVIKLISTVGFPIFVAVWLLWRSDRKEERTQEILQEIKLAIQELKNTLERR